MFPVELLNSEGSAANLLQQVRWRDGLQCPRCRSESVIKYGSYQAYQRYFCKDSDRTFMIVAREDRPHQVVVRVPLVPSAQHKYPPAGAEIDVSYRTLLDVPSLDLGGPVEIDEAYVTAGLKGRERDKESRSRGLSTRG